MPDVEVKVRENGPLLVSGPIVVVDIEGREYVLPEGTAVAFCRCGWSENKPFCDGTHKRNGFAAPSAATG